MNSTIANPSKSLQPITYSMNYHAEKWRKKILSDKKNGLITDTSAPIGEAKHRMKGNMQGKNW